MTVEQLLIGFGAGIALTLILAGLDLYLEHLQHRSQTRLNALDKVNEIDTSKDHLAKLKEDE